MITEAIAAIARTAVPGQEETKSRPSWRRQLGPFSSVLLCCQSDFLQQRLKVEARAVAQIVSMGIEK